MHYELCIQHYFNLSSQRLDKLEFYELLSVKKCRRFGCEPAAGFIADTAIFKIQHNP